MSKPNWEKIREEWETTKKTYKELEEQFNVKSSTIRSRKNREKWQRDATNDATQQKKSVATKKQQAKTPKKNNETKKEPVIENDDLTDKQRLFCIYYIKYFNATKAYQKAYECDYTTAMASGSRLLRNVKVSAEIDRLKEEQASALKLDARNVLQKYIDIAFADITDFTTFGKKEIEVVNDIGEVETREINYVDFKESTEIDGTLITEVKQGRDGISVKLADKMKALDMLSKYFDLLSENDKKRLQEEKLKAEIARVKGDDMDEYEDDGFIEALGDAVEVWNDDSDDGSTEEA